jgi:hypothetical protein
LTDTNVLQESADSTTRIKQNTVQMWWVIWTGYNGGLYGQVTMVGYNKGTWEMARTNNAAPTDPIHFDPEN